MTSVWDAGCCRQQFYLLHLSVNLFHNFFKYPVLQIIREIHQSLKLLLKLTALLFFERGYLCTLHFFTSWYILKFQSAQNRYHMQRDAKELRVHFMEKTTTKWLDSLMNLPLELKFSFRDTLLLYIPYMCFGRHLEHVRK